MKKILYGLILAFIYSKMILPKKEGMPTNLNLTLCPVIYKGMVIIKINKNKAIHIHHWFIYLLILIINNFLKNKLPDIFIGFCYGMIIQGLSYKDRYNFICTNPY